MSGRHRIGMRFIVASMLVGLGLVAPTLARAATTVNLDQWASTDKAWQNGNLNGNNSRYPEGGIVPFRRAMEGLKAGNHSIHINDDFAAQGLTLSVLDDTAGAYGGSETDPLGKIFYPSNA